MYKLVVDNGKPFEEEIYSDYLLFLRLEELRKQDDINDDINDIFIFQEKDVTEEMFEKWRESTMKTFIVKVYDENMTAEQLQELLPNSIVEETEYHKD